MGGHYGGKAKAAGATVGKAGFDTDGTVVFWRGVVWTEGARTEGISWVGHADGEDYAELWVLDRGGENRIAQELQDELVSLLCLPMDLFIYLLQVVSQPTYSGFKCIEVRVVPAVTCQCGLSSTSTLGGI